MDLVQTFYNNFPFQPSPDQTQFFTCFSKFLVQDSEKPVYVLSGFAGTGKTTCVAAIVKSMPFFKMQTVLLAPTGRAAKVMSNYAGQTAYTIHKKIYRKKSAIGFDLRMQLAPNLHKNTLFIVDESSMIDDSYNAGQIGSLLTDLIQFVFQKRVDGKENNCKLLLVGDSAQLPPVGSLFSPALDKTYLDREFQLQVVRSELKNVLRQAVDSGILYNATLIRKMIAKEQLKSFVPKLKTKAFSDVFVMTGQRFVEGLEYAYKEFGLEQSLVVCRSNKSATLYNQQIRSRVFYRDELLSGGDQVMVVKNNYHWLPENNISSFIANGDMAKVVRVRNVEEKYGYTFAEVSLEFLDYEELGTITCKCLLDTLSSYEPNLNVENQKKLYQQLLTTYEHLPRNEQNEAIKKDEYYNALQLKFAYAVTCHKAQGGQWQAVFVDQGYLTEEQVNLDFLRWLYTAITRAKTRLFLINFSNLFFTEEQIDIYDY